MKNFISLPVALFSLLISFQGSSQPAMFVTPDTISATLNCNDSISVPLTIYNTGSSNLTFTLNTNNGVPPLFYENFEDGNYNGWSAGTCGFVYTVTASNPGVGTQSLQIQGGCNNHFQGLRQAFATATPSYVSFYVKAPQTTAYSTYCLLGNDPMLSTGTIGWFYFRNDGQMGLAGGAVTYVSPYIANQWYHVEYKNINFTTFTFDYYVNGVLGYANYPFRDNLNNLSSIHLYNFDNSTAFYDEIIIGDGPLGVSWIDADTNSGVINPGDSLIANILLNSSGLTVGNYTSTVLLTSNDPLNPDDSIPVILNVTGSADFYFFLSDTIFSSCLYLDSIAANTTSVDSIVINNTGCDTLFIDSITLSPSLFSLTSAPLIVLPGGSDIAIFNFNPVAAGSFSSTVNIYTSDIDTSFCLGGYSFLGPEILVSPDSFLVTLPCNDSTTIQMNIYNTGGSVLNWNITSQTTISDDFDPAINASIWSLNTGVANTICTSFSGNSLYFNGAASREASTIDLNTFSGGMISFYLALPQGGAPCEAADAGTESVVLEYSNNGGGSWTIITTYLNNGYPALTFISENIPSAAQTSATRFRWRQLNHSGSGYDNWVLDNVTINLYAFAGANPASGAVPAGDSDVVSINISSVGFLAGQYTNVLFVNSDDASDPQVQVVYVMDVAGTPEMSMTLSDISGGCLYLDSIAANTTSIDSVVINNTGCDTLFIDSITLSPSLFSLTSAPLMVLPGGSDIAVFDFSPVGAGSFSSSVIIYTNDIDTSICLAGYSFLGPEILVSPDSFLVTLPCNDSTTIQMNIYNTGGSVLNWNITSQATIADDFDPAINASMWSLNTGVANTTCTSFSGNSLYFNGAASREASTIDLNTFSGGVITFYLALPQGGAPCEAADAGTESVVLEYSNNGGGSWTIITTYLNNGYPALTFISENIPSAAQTSATRFRWRQLNHSGSGYDNWVLDNVTINLYAFADANPASGAVPAGDSDVVNINISSVGFLAGQYTNVLFVNSDDASNPQIQVVYIMDVTGTPEIGLSGSCIVFDTIFQSANTTDTLILFNTGCDTLTLDSITTSNSIFTVLSSPPYVTPFGSGIVVVQFSPLTVATFSENLAIYSNATDTSVCLSGISLAPPVIAVNPDSFNVSVGCGDSLVTSLTIYNTGGADLTLTTTTSGTGVPIGPLCTPITTGYCCSIGIYNVTFNTINNTTGDGIDGYRNYDTLNTVVLPGNSYTLSVQTGNLWSENVRGWIDYNNNGIFETAFGEEVLATVNTLPNQMHSAIVTIPLSAVKNVPLRMRIGSDYSGNTPPQPCLNVTYGQFEDYAIMINGPVMLSPAAGTIIPSDSMVVNVIFDSQNLTVGQYSGNITINSNDPATPQTLIAYIMNVTGTSEMAITLLDVTGGCLDLDSILQYSTSTDTINLYNNGCDTLIINTVSASPSEFGYSLSGTIIPPFGSGYVAISFSPVVTGSFSGTLNLTTNDYDTVICLTGYSLPAPEISIDPDSFNVVLSCADSLGFPLTIYNTGGSVLNWSVTSQTTVSDDFDPVINTSLWSLNTGVANTTCTSFSGNSLYFNGAASREASTFDFNTISGGLITFYLALPQGGAPCEAADAGTESVVLEYSNNGGGLWTTLSTYLNNGYPALTFISENIPSAAQTSATRFRWRQLSHSGSGFDNWVLDEITITVGFAGLTVSPSSGTVAPSDSTVAVVLFTQSGQAAGTYNFNIYINSNDPLNSQLAVPVTLTIDSTPLVVSFGSVSNVTCNGGSDGIIDLDITSGCPPYTFIWSNGDFTEDQIGVPAGPYDVTVTDNTGSTASFSITLNEPAALTSTISGTTAAGCIVCNGTASVSAGGGIPPYSYLWDALAQNQTTTTATGLCAGSYNVIVSDAKGCTGTKVAVIAGAGGLSSNITIFSDMSCFGVCNGDATVSTSGGTPPYTISWNTGSSSATISGLCQGNYTVTITDNGGCIANSNITLYEPGLLSLTLDSFNATCGTCADGAINLTVSGGTAPFTYQWSESSVTQDITGLLPGSYSVTVSDANGCQANGSVMVDFTTATIYNRMETGIFLYPNPAGEKFTLLIEGATQGLFEILLLNATGQQVVKKEISGTGGLSKIDFDTRSYKEGLYLIRISTPEGTWLRKVGVAR